MANETILVNPDTGSRHRLGGCIPSEKPSDLPKFSATRTVTNKQLPPGVDLRQFMTPVEQQDELNSCVGNALAAAYEFLIMKNTRKIVDVSRLFIYYNGRLKEGYQEYSMQDNGTLITSAIKGLHEFGCCKEELYPYDVSKVNRKPPPNCYSEAKNYRIKEGMQIDTDLNEMKACLAEGYPFAFGIETFYSFHKAEKNGIVPMPQVQFESQNPQHGWHAMLAVGYSDQTRCFIVKNSWGANWGDKGYCYIPYDYMGNPRHCRDLHAIKLITEDRSRRSDHQQHQEQEIPNPYDWFKHRDIPHYIPSNYHYDFFDYRWFWKVNDHHNYFETIIKNGKVFPSVWSASSSPDSGTVSSEKTSSMSYILWIDKNREDNANVMKQVTSGKHVHVDFRETFAMAEDHLLRNMDKIKSTSPSSKFQIICRGYYPNENKNPLNLLKFLDNYKLKHIPIIVFTQDKQGVRNHLEHQAPSMGICDWKNRLHITDDINDLVTKIKANISNKLGNGHH